MRTYRATSTASGTAVPTYVIVHGIGLSHRFYSRLARALTPTGHVVSFDLPGFGVTARPTRTLSIEDHAALVCERITANVSRPVVVVGHSMGAQIAVEVARRLPDVVDRVVLIGPVTDTRRPTLRAQAARLLRDAAVEPPRTQLAVVFDYVRCGIPWFARQAFVMRDYATPARAREVGQPVLVLRGEHDPIAPPAWASWLAGQTRHGLVVDIPGARHNVPHSRPDETAAAIAAFANAGDDGD